MKVSLVIGGAAASDLGWKGKENRAEQVKKYKNDLHMLMLSLSDVD